MKKEAHLRNLKESLGEIDEAIREGLENKQRSLGFHTSAACVDMIELLLHKKNLVDPGFVLKHEWLKSEKVIAFKLNFDFTNKAKIIELAKNIEFERNKLCYGPQQPEYILRKVVNDFNNLKEILKGDLDELR